MFGVTVFVFCSTADTLEFKQKVLTMFSDELGLQGWTQASVAPALFPLQAERLTLKRISGAFTNAVFFGLQEAFSQDLQILRICLEQTFQNWPTK